MCPIPIVFNLTFRSSWLTAIYWICNYNSSNITHLYSLDLLHTLSLFGRVKVLLYATFDLSFQTHCYRTQKNLNSIPYFTRSPLKFFFFVSIISIEHDPVLIFKTIWEGERWNSVKYAMWKKKLWSSVILERTN